MTFVPSGSYKWREFRESPGWWLITFPVFYCHEPLIKIGYNIVCFSPSKAIPINLEGLEASSSPWDIILCVKPLYLKLYLRYVGKVYFCSLHWGLSCSWGAVCTVHKSGWRVFPMMHWKVSVPILLCSWRLELMRKSLYVNVRHVAITSHNGIVMATSITWFFCFCDVAACFILWVFSFLVCGWTHLLPSWAWILVFKRRGRTEGETGKLTEWYILRTYYFILLPPLLLTDILVINILMSLWLWERGKKCLPWRESWKADRNET